MAVAKCEVKSIPVLEYNIQPQGREGGMENSLIKDNESRS
jgi:hypothetical protein